MGFFPIYLIAILPIGIGLYLWLTNKQIVWWEYIVGAAASLIFAGIFHAIVFASIGIDTETWSGEVIKATYHPYWHATWTETYTTTDSEGNTHFHTRIKSESHPEYWDLDTSLSQNKNISKIKFEEVLKNFGGQMTIEKPFKPHFDGGDRNIYVAYNKTNYIIPVTDKRNWKNRIKASKNIFNFVDIPKSLENSLFKYPENNNIFISDRVMGIAQKSIDIQKWDALNSLLGPIKKVNVIICGFDNSNTEYGQYQEAFWRGGKKNDLVICYGPDNIRPIWCYVFGWTEKDLVKQNLQTVILNNGVNNNVIDLIKKEIYTNYQIKDWEKFNYISIDPPVWSYFIFFILTCIIQFGIYSMFKNNEFEK